MQCYLSQDGNVADSGDSSSSSLESDTEVVDLEDDLAMSEPKQNHHDKSRQNKTTNKPKREKYVKKYHTTEEVKQKLLIHNPIDVEENETEIHETKGGRPRMLPKPQPQQSLGIKEDVKIRIRQLDRKRLPLAILRKYKNQPKLKIMGTWNYLYGGHGACDWSYDSNDKKRRNVYVSNGTKLSKNNQIVNCTNLSLS